MPAGYSVAEAILAFLHARFDTCDVNRFTSPEALAHRAISASAAQDDKARPSPGRTGDAIRWISLQTFVDF